MLLGKKNQLSSLFFFFLERERFNCDLGADSVNILGGNHAGLGEKV